MASTRTKVIGTTRLIDVVGKGGMAEVYRGLQETLQREVAVKVMLPELTRDKEAVTRFRREALALAGLQHENIVAIHDLVEKNDQLFMIMEFVEGVDVATLLKQGPLPLDVALLIAHGVASALEHAHFRKVIHRDIKPANILISRTGEVKLTDFGIAKDLTIDDLTKTGLVIGTPAYLAPEQVTGGRPDHRTDLYALGVVMFQCLAGEKPFRAKTQGELFIAIARGDRARVRQMNAEIPRAIEKIVEKCLAVRPDKRYRRASELCRALESRLAGTVQGASSARLVNYLRGLGHVDDEDLSSLDVEGEWYDASQGSDDSDELESQSGRRGGSNEEEDEEEEEFEEDLSGEQDGASAKSSSLQVSVQVLAMRTRLRKGLRLVSLLLLLSGASLFAAWNFAPARTSRALHALSSWAKDLSSWAVSKMGQHEAASDGQARPASSPALGDQLKPPESPASD